VRVTAGDWNQTQSFRVVADPRVTTSEADLQQQFALLMQIHETMGTIAEAGSDIQDVRGQLTDLVARMGRSDQQAQLKAAATPVLEKLSAIEAVLVPTDGDHLMKNLDRPPKLSAQYRALYGYVASADAKPTAGAVERFGDLKAQLAKELTALTQVFETDLRAFNAMLREKDVPSVIIPARRRTGTSVSEQPGFEGSRD
jgi:hypothetical protein